MLVCWLYTSTRGYRGLRYTENLSETLYLLNSVLMSLVTKNILLIVLYLTTVTKKNIMKKTSLIVISVLSVLFCFGQGVENYYSLDAKHPISFVGKYIVYNGDTILLGPRSFFIDGRLADTVTERYPYVFNSVNKAVQKITNGTEESPMTLFIAPYVYWIDNPDDTATRVGVNGQPPFGLVVKCEWLKFHGLSNDPKNVVLACNRGQTIGAKGNFTMFRFFGNGTSSENITFGNYCNVDLNYPLLPALNRKKRASAIVQAQLIICDGDKIIARNSSFISRLNLCPFVGGKRVLFDRCHFESTDDALCGTGVYLNCTLDMYSSKPFYRTNGTGAVFLNCDITSYVKGEQFFTKAPGQVAVIDTRFKTAANTYIGWQDVVPLETRNYQYGVMQNGKTVFISQREAANTINLKAESLLYAYRFSNKGKVVYNTYNLLQGNDDWDPMAIKKIVQQSEKELKVNLTKIPVQLLVSPTRVSVETNKNDVVLTTKMLRFGNYEASGDKINWRIAKGYDSLVKLNVSEDGLTCKVIPVSKFDDTKDVVVIASTAAGLEAASVITVAPSILPAPGFTVAPGIAPAPNGQLHLNYKLDAAYKDQSLVNWYRCSDAKGSNAIEVAVSRLNEPFINYTLTAGDAGYYIMATIQPKHIRSETGKAISVVMQNPVSTGAIKTDLHKVVTDFKNISTRNQPAILPGFFTWAHLRPIESDRAFAVDTTKDAWYYGKGSEGAADIPGVMQGRNGKMRYTPVGEKFDDMQLTLTVSPFKSAGQGFSVAPLYMDVLIKMDNKTMNGYGLRLIRTTKYGDAVDAYFVQYENGVAKQISDAISTSVFRTVCTIVINATGDILSAKLTTTASPANGTQGVQPTVDIKTAIQPNNFGGIGIEFRGGSPVVFSDLKVEWK